jgi:hypothetical protein
MWTLAFGHHEDRTPTHGREPTREAAMALAAKINLTHTARHHAERPSRPRGALRSRMRLSEN